jgi:hypothetical protein
VPQQTAPPTVFLYIFFSCDAATQRGSCPNSWGFSRSHTTTRHS